MKATTNFGKWLNFQPTNIFRRFFFYIQYIFSNLKKKTFLFLQFQTINLLKAKIGREYGDITPLALLHKSAFFILRIWKIFSHRRANLPLFRELKMADDDVIHTYLNYFSGWSMYASYWFQKKISVFWKHLAFSLKPVTHKTMQCLHLI